MGACHSTYRIVPEATNLPKRTNLPNTNNRVLTIPVMHHIIPYEKKNLNKTKY